MPSPFTDNLAYGEVEPIPTFPFADTVNNLAFVDEEMAKMSDDPAVPVMSSLARGEVVPIPRLPATVRPTDSTPIGLMTTVGSWLAVTTFT